MARVLITAFEPYDIWPDNASWLTLIEFTRELPDEPQITTRRYPVDFQLLKKRLEQDISQQYDHVILLGQAPGATQIQLETIGINRAVSRGGRSTLGELLVPNGPVAYATDLPADAICQELQAAGIPSCVSFHAGTYLCNAALYLTLHLIAEQKLRTQALFVHVPVDPAQAVAYGQAMPSMPVSMSAQAVRILLSKLPARPIELA